MLRHTLCSVAIAGALSGVASVAAAPPLADAAAPPAAPSGPPASSPTDHLAGWGRAATDSPSDDIAVEVLVDPAADAADQVVRSLVESLGGTVTGVVPGYIVQAEFPAGALTRLDGADGVRYVREPQAQGHPIGLPDPHPGRGRLDTQALTGEEIAHTNVAAWHAAGRTGAGVKIGIVDGFDGDAWNANVASGDLPALDAAHTLCVGVGAAGPGQPCDIWNDGVTHGVAVAELIHEIAPEAELFIASALTVADLQTAVDWFAANGVTVVNRSLGDVPDGPGDGTGPLDAVVDDAVSHGMAWFNSAGNEAGRGVSGHYYRAPFTDDGSENRFHRFVAPDSGDSQVPAGGPYPLLGMECELFVLSSLRWNDWDSDNPTDYDFELYLDPFGTVLIGESRQRQSAGAPPIETIETLCIPGLPVYLAVRLVSPGDGTDGDVLEIFGEAALELWSTPYSAAYPVVDSNNPGVFAIGANEADHTISYYSSAGPVNDGRIKPDFTARSNVSSNALGNFQGTSASSPIAAGMAALVFGARLADSPAALRQWFVDYAAHDRGAPGPDNDFGHGELVLPVPTIVPVDPVRLLDTRGGATFDGSFTAGGRATAGSSLTVPVAGFGEVAARAEGIVVNLTAIAADGPGFATLYPCDQAPPTASHVNYLGGDVVANNVTVPVGADGNVCIFSSAGADFTLDVSGYVPEASPVQLFTPQRFLDTRLGQSTFDGRDVGAGASRGTRQIQIAGRGSIPHEATAAIVSVTAVNPAEAGYVTVYPCNTDPTRASTLNYGPGEVVPNGAIAQLSPTGKLCVYASSPTDLVLDISGYVPPGTQLGSSGPARLFDTRLDGATVDAGFLGWGPFPANSHAEITVAGRADVPAGATGAIVNITAIGPDGPGFLSVWPCGEMPGTSILNHAAGGVVRANNAVVKLSAIGTLCLYSLAGTQATVDVTGWLVG